MSTSSHKPPLYLVNQLLIAIAAVLLTLTLSILLLGNNNQTGISHWLSILLICIAFFGVILCAYLGYLWNKRVLGSIRAVNEYAGRLLRSDFSQPKEDISNGNLRLIIDAFNYCCTTISLMGKGLEQQVNEQLQIKLKQQSQHSRQELQSLKIQLACANLFNGPLHQSQALEMIANQLAEVTGFKDIDICLKRADKEQPYAHIYTDQTKILSNDCETLNCSKCIANSPFCAHLPEVHQHKFPLIKDRNNYGVIVCNLVPGGKINKWQQNLLSAVVAQLATVLAANDQNQTLH